MGSQRVRDPSSERAGEVKPFESEPGTPAIPASSLRGLISSIAEAASNSAMRVLEDKFYSYRKSMQDRGDILSAIGMVVVNEDAATKHYSLRPLILPTIRIKRRGGPAVLPDEYRGMFPVPNLKVYIGDAATIRDPRRFPYSTYRPDGPVFLRAEGRKRSEMD